MDDFTPEFVTHWLAEAGDERVAESDERGTWGDDEALVELADLVLAARSVV